MNILAIFLLAALTGSGYQTGQIDLYYSAGRPRSIPSIARDAQSGLTYLEDQFGLEYHRRVSLVIVNTDKAFSEAQPDGQFIPSWAGGTAWPSLSLIVIHEGRTGPGKGLKRVLLHELAHLALGQAFGGNDPPAWLNEGLAMHLAGEWDVGRQFAMLRALAADRVVPLETLMNAFPTDRIDAETAYAESYYFMAYLKDVYGGEITGRLISDLGHGIKPAYALWSATGLKMPVLETAFEKWLARRFSMYWIFTSDAGLWGMVVLLFLAAYVLKKRSAVRRMAEWEKQEENEDNESNESKSDSEWS